MPKLITIPIEIYDWMRKTEAIRGYRLRMDHVSKDGKDFLCHRVCFSCQQHVPEGETCCTIQYFRAGEDYTHVINLKSTHGV